MESMSHDNQSLRHAKIPDPKIKQKFYIFISVKDMHSKQKQFLENLIKNWILYKMV